MCIPKIFADLTLVQLLIKYGADVTARTSDTQTPLHYAALSFDTGILQAIIDANPATKGKVTKFYLR